MIGNDRYSLQEFDYDTVLVIFRKYRRGRARYQDLYHSSLERTNQMAYYSIMGDHPKVER